MSRFVRCTGMVVAATFAMTLGLASANTKTVTDAQNDQGEDTLDLKSATHGHTKSGKLFHKVVTYGSFGAAKAGTISVQIKVGTKLYSLSKYGLWDPESQAYKAVTVKRPTNKSIQYIFGKAKIGNPNRYKWYVQSVPPFPCLVCPDFLPNQQTTGNGNWVTHVL